MIILILTFRDRLQNTLRQIDLLSKLISFEYFDSSSDSWLARLTDFVHNADVTRTELFNWITKKKKKIQFNIPPNFKKIKDIYMHSIQYTDDIITPKIYTLKMVTELVSRNVKQIRYIANETQDFIYLFLNSLDKEVNYLVSETNADELAERVILKLNSRILYHTKKDI